MHRRPRLLPWRAEARSGLRMRAGRTWLAVGLTAAFLASCGLAGGPERTPLAVPAPSCGGAKILIPGSIPCEELVRFAIDVIRAEAPSQLDRGIVAVTVELQGCPKQALPAQIDCAGEPFVQLVTLNFGAPVEGGPIEPSLSVALAPVSGRVLGIVNPLIR
ncbi:MAG: hypothetical protein HW391_1755 [Chloroflexi bacterium]|nr:hypothetical protein [Chloroflexota bacterium]